MMRWGIWCVCIFALYEMTAMVQDASEVIVGIIVTVLSVALIWWAFRQSKVDLRVSWRSARKLAGVPAKMLADSVMVLSRIIRGDLLEGYFERQPLDEDPIAIYGICAAPNTIVADVTDRDLLVHRLTAPQADS